MRRLLLSLSVVVVVAVPAVILYNYFLRRIAVMLTQAENGARRLRQSLAEAPAQAPAPALRVAARAA